MDGPSIDCQLILCHMFFQVRTQVLTSKAEKEGEGRGGGRGHEVLNFLSQFENHLLARQWAIEKLQSFRAHTRHHGQNR